MRISFKDFRKLIKRKINIELLVKILTFIYKDKISNILKSSIENINDYDKEK